MVFAPDTCSNTTFPIHPFVILAACFWTVWGNRGALIGKPLSVVCFHIAWWKRSTWRLPSCPLALSSACPPPSAQTWNTHHCPASASVAVHQSFCWARGPGQGLSVCSLWPAQWEDVKQEVEVHLTLKWRETVVTLCPRFCAPAVKKKGKKRKRSGVKKGVYLYTLNKHVVKRKNTAPMKMKAVTYLY